MYKYVILILLLFGCESYKPPVVDNVESKPVKYEKIDVKDIENSKKSLNANKEKRIELIKKGSDRADRFEPLLLSLIAFHEYNQEIKLADVSPFIAELPHIASISTYEEKQEFVRIGAEDSMSTKKIITEADKGKASNDKVKMLEIDKTELQKKIDNKYIDKTISISEKFYYLAGLIFIVSCLRFIPIIVPIANHLMWASVSVAGMGTFIMLTGTFIETVRSFLESWGNIVLWVSILPLIILMYLLCFKKGHDVVEEIKDDDIND